MRHLCLFLQDPNIDHFDVPDMSIVADSSRLWFTQRQNNTPQQMAVGSIVDMNAIRANQQRSLVYLVPI